MPYADVNGLHMYYEVHGTAIDGVRPLVLLPGAFSGVETSFGSLLPGLAKTRQVIAVEQQAHAHTNDTDRPLTYPGMAADTVALLRSIGVERADFFGYSVGGGVAVEIAASEPAIVGRIVVANPAHSRESFYPEMLAGAEAIAPEMLHGSPFHDEYLRTAPDPDAFPALVAKVGALNAGFQGWSPETIKAITAPAFLVAADSDIVRPESVAETFRLFGGGVIGDIVGLPAARLAILPGTTHMTMIQRADYLVPMVTEFLDSERDA